MPTPIETTDSQPWMTSSFAAAPIDVVPAAIAVATFGLLAAASMAERALSSFIVLSFKNASHRRHDHDAEPQRAKNY